MKRAHHFFNMYFTAAISVFLVLLMIGVECVLLLSAVNAVSHFKENAVVTAMLSGNVDSVGIAQVDSQLHAWPYFSKIEFTSRQQALEQHIDELGDTASTDYHLPIGHASGISVVQVNSQEQGVTGSALIRN